MGWAANHIVNLTMGKTVLAKPKGNSMVPLINSGETVEIEPVGQTELKKNQIVLCRVRGVELLHKITGVKEDQVQISNNSGYVNGWISKNQVFGIMTKKIG